jgi:hypothetical protein
MGHRAFCSVLRALISVQKAGSRRGARFFFVQGKKSADLAAVDRHQASLSFFIADLQLINFPKLILKMRIIYLFLYVQNLQYGQQIDIETR